MKPRLTIALLLGVVATPVGAQVPHSEGPFAGAGVAVSLGPGGSLPSDDMWFKSVGFTSALPHSFTAAAGTTRPDFSGAAILYDRSLLCGRPTASIDIDAMSIGLDQIWADNQGLVTVPPINWPWSALAFSVGPGAGEAGSVIAQERDRVDGKAGAEGDLFTHILGLGTAPAQWSATTLRAHDRGEMGLAASDDIDALDLNLQLYEADDDLFAALAYRFPGVANPTLYFSVSNATVANVPSGWWGSATPSGANILSTTWNGIRWTCPTVFRSHSQLGLAAPRDIIALAVDSVKQSMLFSEAPHPVRLDPIMFYGWGPSTTTPTPVVFSYPTENQTGTEVSKMIGVKQTDRIDALCELDPSMVVLQGGTIGSSNYAFGRPLEQNLCFPWTTRVNGSLFRTGNAAGSPELHAYLTGWPRGVPESGIGIAVFHAFNPLATGCFAYPGAPAKVILPRNSGSPFCGGPTGLVLPLPPAAALSGAAIVVDWVAISTGSSFGQIGYTFPMALSFF